MNAGEEKKDALTKYNDAYQFLNQFSGTFEQLNDNNNTDARQALFEHKRDIQDNFLDSRDAYKELEQKGMLMPSINRKEKKIVAWKEAITQFTKPRQRKTALGQAKELHNLDYHLQQMQMAFNNMTQEASIKHKKYLVRAWQVFKAYVKETKQGKPEFVKWTKQVKSMLQK